MRKGFSLIELMIVIVILGLLAGLVMPNLMGKGEEAKQKIVCVQMNNLNNALDMFKSDNGVYPSTEEGLDALIKNPDADRYPGYSSAAYISSKKGLPKDSWKTEFIYTNEDDEFDIISLGSDRKEGMSGKDGKDIRYSECK